MKQQAALIFLLDQCKVSPSPLLPTPLLPLSLPRAKGEVMRGGGATGCVRGVNATRCLTGVPSSHQGLWQPNCVEEDQRNLVLVPLEEKLGESLISSLDFFLLWFVLFFSGLFCRRIFDPNTSRRIRASPPKPLEDDPPVFSDFQQATGHSAGFRIYHNNRRNI